MISVIEKQHAKKRDGWNGDLYQVNKRRGAMPRERGREGQQYLERRANKASGSTSNCSLLMNSRSWWLGLVGTDGLSIDTYRCHTLSWELFGGKFGASTHVLWVALWAFRKRCPPAFLPYEGMSVSPDEQQGSKGDGGPRRFSQMDQLFDRSFWKRDGRMDPLGRRKNGSALRCNN